MNKTINIGVVGVGHLGKHHVRHFSKIKDVNLVGLFDIDEEESKKVSLKYKTRSFRSLKDILKVVDAVSIVTPTSTHKAVAEMCLKKGKHVFIEKPITKTISEAEELLRLSKKCKKIIQVGHIERFNSALLPLKDFNVQPRYIEVHRLAPYMIRGTDIPVVLDLMIHDIDLVLSIINSPVKNIEASGVSIMTESVDIANARIHFKNGSVANITSSRVAKDKVRKIKLFQQDLYITIDFLIGLTEVYRVMDANETDSSAIISAPLEAEGKHRQIFYEKPKIKKQDALEMELRNFIESVQGISKPIVDGRAGKLALEVAMQIQNKILEGLK